MKIRSDFVSNSSSSSFVILGKIYDYEDFINQKTVDAELYEQYTNDLGDADLYDVYEAIKNKAESLGLVVEYAGYDGDMREFCIGIDPDNIKDTDVLGDVKKIVADSISKFGLDTDASDIRFVPGGCGADGASYFDCCG